MTDLRKDLRGAPDPARAIILSRIARDYNVAIYEVGAQAALYDLDDRMVTLAFDQHDVGYHP